MDHQVELQQRLDSGISGPIEQKERLTLTDAKDRFINQKVTENIAPATLAKLRGQIGAFITWMESRHRYFVSDISVSDITEFRATWNDDSTLTKQVKQVNLRQFLRKSLNGERLEELLNSMGSIKLSREDYDRLKPRPLSEDDITSLMAEIPKRLPEDKAKTLTLAVRVMLSTGIAVIDCARLKKSEISDGWLKIRRQKTSRPVLQRLSEGLHKALMTYAGNHEYIFYRSNAEFQTMINIWSEQVRDCQKALGIHVSGNLMHRFRDTFVDFHIGQGTPLTEIAAMIGDSVRTTEAHYADLLSQRAKGRIAAVPVREWGD